MRLTGNFKKNSKNFFSIFSFLRAFVVSSCRKSGFRVFLSFRYGADLGRSRLVLILLPTQLVGSHTDYEHSEHGTATLRMAATDGVVRREAVRWLRAVLFG